MTSMITAWMKNDTIEYIRYWENNTLNQKKIKEKKWWHHLLVIPVMIVVDVIALFAAAMADTAIAGDGPGHPAPIFLLLVVVIGGFLTAVLLLRAVILCMRDIIRDKKNMNN